MKPTRPSRRSPLTKRDQLRELYLDLVTRLPRTLLTAAGTAIGTAVLVATIGLAASAAARITTHFDELAATDIIVKPTDQSHRLALTKGEPGAVTRINPDSAMRINGVTAATAYGKAQQSPPIGGLQLPGQESDIAGISLVVSSPGLPETVNATINGRFFDQLLSDRAEPVAVIGKGLVKDLGVRSLNNQPVIFVQGQPLTVIGIIEDTKLKPELMRSVVVSTGWAKAYTTQVSPDQIIVRTKIGAVDVVKDQLAVALLPRAPEELRVSARPTPTVTRDKVSADTQGLLFALASISMIVGAVGITNATLVSVMERTPEIGLRRSLGARTQDIVKQFMYESAAIGFLGGTIGAALGVLVSAAASIINDWPPIIDPWISLGAPLIGAILGAIAGIYPAYRAGKVDPLDALRTA